MQPQELPRFVVDILQRTREIAASVPLWPDWDPMSTPLVLHSPAVAYLIGHPSPPAEYEALEPVGALTVHAGPTASTMVANTAAVVYGTMSALIILPKEPPADRDRFARLILHECFHAHQALALRAVRKPDFQVASLYPEYDMINNALSVVENRLLARALELSTLVSPAGEAAFGPTAMQLAPAADPAPGEDRNGAPVEDRDSLIAYPQRQPVEGAAAAYMAVRLARQERLTERGLGNVAQYEADSEFNEGTPTYVEMRAGHPLAELITNLQTLSRGGKGNSYLRYYSTGAATALLLDRLAPQWHAAFAGGGETLQSLLRSYLPQVLPGVDEVLSEAGYESLLDEEERLEAERQRQITRLLAGIHEGPGVLVEILFPRETQVMFNPQAVISVRPGVKLHPTHSGLGSGTGVSAWIQHVCLEERDPRRFLVRLPQAPVNQAESGLHLTAPGFELKSPLGTIETMGDRYLQIDLT